MVKSNTRVQQVNSALNCSGGQNKWFSRDVTLFAAAEFFKARTKKHRYTTALIGHKWNGKTQLLYFVARLLQKLGEPVVYVDQTVLTKGNQAFVQSTDACIHVFQDQLKKLLTPAFADIGVLLDKFARSGKRDDFVEFHTQLKICIARTKERVWLIADECPKIVDEHDYLFPEAQGILNFRLIATGSNKMMDLIQKQHWSNVIIEMPLLSPKQQATLALNVTPEQNRRELWTKVDAKYIDGAEAENLQSLTTAVDDACGGILGYVVNLAIEDDYVAEWDKRIIFLLDQAAGNVHKVTEDMAPVWLARIQSADQSKWHFLLKSGLCGPSGPRGTLLSRLVAHLINCLRNSLEEQLSHIQKVRRSVGRTEPSLDGGLLELEVILKLKLAHPFKFQLIQAKSAQPAEEHATHWEKTSSALVITSQPQIYFYDEDRKDLSQSIVRAHMDKIPDPRLFLVELPPSFPILDVLLVETGEQQKITFYLLQITRSAKPFAQHETNETGPEISVARITQLLKSTAEALGYATEETISAKSDNVKYVLLAPNTSRGAWVAPVGHTSAYYFSRGETFEDEPTRKKMRKSLVCLAFLLLLLVCNCALYDLHIFSQAKPTATSPESVKTSVLDWVCRVWCEK